MKSKKAKYQGIRPKILLSSVFGPYARDDEYGGRKINPMELFHNQVTRVQGPFSLRMFHPSLGLMMIQENLNAPCTFLDFPLLDRFIEEIKTKMYDIIGIGSIIPNVGKVRKMCQLIREYQPGAIIVVGGHVANLPDIHDRIDADYIVLGEGVRWFRDFLGEDAEAPIKHPAVYASLGTRILGSSVRERHGGAAAALIPSVGCPMGCNFCATSHMFGGKGKSINFYDTGDELFEVMCDLEKKLMVNSFFVLDENFLLHKKRTLRLLELMIEHHKGWTISTFSSARVIKSYTDEQLIRLGLSWVWMGLEGASSQYKKLNNIDTRELITHLQSLGINFVGSSIIGLENHTPENVDEAIDWAVSHNTVFHQFMLYTPLPGTPLYEEHRKKGTLLTEEECDVADTHGQYRFNFNHPHIKNQQETNLLLRAFNRDFKVNGPSLFRLIRSLFMGYKANKNHLDHCVQQRLELDAVPLRTTYAAALWVMKRWYRHDIPIYKKIKNLLKDLYEEFGWKTRILANLMGPLVYLLAKLEAKRLARGWTYEPESSYIKNAAALALDDKPGSSQFEIGEQVGEKSPEKKTA